MGSPEMAGAMESRQGGLGDSLLHGGVVVLLLSLTITTSSSLSSPPELVLVGEDGVPGPLLLAALELMDESEENPAKIEVEEGETQRLGAVLEEPMVQELAVKVCDESKDLKDKETVMNTSVKEHTRKGRGRMASRYRNVQSNPEVKVARRRVRVQNRVRQKRKLSMDGRGENMVSPVSSILDTDPTLQLPTSTRKLKSRMGRRKHIPRLQEDLQQKEEKESENQTKEVVTVRPVRVRMRIPTRNIPKKKDSWNEHARNHRGPGANKEKIKRSRIMISRAIKNIREKEKKTGDNASGRRRGTQHINMRIRSKEKDMKTEAITMKPSSVDTSDKATEVTTGSELETTSGSVNQEQFEEASTTGALTIRERYQDGRYGSNTQAENNPVSTDMKHNNVRTSMKFVPTHNRTSMKTKSSNNTIYMKSRPSIEHMENETTYEDVSMKGKQNYVMTSNETNSDNTMTTMDTNPTY